MVDHVCIRIKAVLSKQDAEVLCAGTDEEIDDFYAQTHSLLGDLYAKCKEEENVSLKQLHAAVEKARKDADVVLPMPPLPVLVEPSAQTSTPDRSLHENCGDDDLRTPAFTWLFWPVSHEAVWSILKACRAVVFLSWLLVVATDIVDVPAACTGGRAVPDSGLR